MNQRQRLVFLALICVAVAMAFVASTADARGPGRMRRRTHTAPVATSAAGICTVFSIAGQSLSVGLNGGVGLSTTPSATDYILNAGNTALCPLQEGTGCGFTNVESPVTGLVSTYRSLLGGTTPAIIGLNSGLGSTTIEAWADGSATTHTQAWTTDVTAARDLVAAAPATYGCSAINVRAIFWVHGESSFNNATYGTQLASIQSSACTDIQAVTGQATCPIWVLSPPTTWNVGNSFTGIPTSMADQVARAAADSFTHVIDGKYIEPYEVAATPLHLTNAGYRHIGAQAGKAIYRILEGGDAEFGLWPSTAAASGSTIQVCFDAPVAPLVLDTTTCPAHGNGDYGIEYYQGEVGAPTISSVAVNGTNTNCLDLTMSSAPRDYAGKMLRGAYTAQAVLGTHQGCQTPGYPYTNIRDSDATSIFGGGSARNWSLPFNVPITGGAARAATQATGYFRFNVSSEAVTMVDAADLEVGQHATWVWWMREGTLTHSRRITMKSAAWDFLTWHSGGFDGVNLYLNNPAWNARFYNAIAGQTGVWHSVVVVYDGTQSTAALRLRAWHNCLESSQVGPSGTSPTTLADNANPVQINATASGHADINISIWAQWVGTSASLAQVAEICQSSANYSTSTLGQPTIEARPDTDDTNLVITNHGSSLGVWVPSGLESDDVVQGGGP